MNIEETGNASGQEIQLINLAPSLKANLRAQEKKTEYVKVSKGSSEISWGSWKGPEAVGAALRSVGAVRGSWGSFVAVGAALIQLGKLSRSVGAV